MNFLIFLAAVSFNRYWIGEHPFDLNRWLAEAVFGSQDKENPTASQLRHFLLYLLPLPLLVALMLWLLEGVVYGLVGAALSVLVLLVSVGTSRLDDFKSTILYWVRGGFNTDDRSDLDDRLAKVSAAEFQNLYPALFWFVALGPAGALLYRLTIGYTQQQNYPLAEKVLHYMDWFPLRLSGAGLVLLGNFSSSVDVWVESLADVRHPTTRQLTALLNAAAASPGVDETTGSPDEMNVVQEKYELQRRLLPFWIAIAALATVLGWL